MNIYDALVLLLVTASVVFAVRSMRKAHSRGRCTSCPYGGQCSKKKGGCA